MYMYATMKKMCPTSYPHNSFLSKAIAVISRSAHGFHDCIHITSILHIYKYTRSQGLHTYIYTYIYIYIYFLKTHLFRKQSFCKESEIFY